MKTNIKNADYSIFEVSIVKKVQKLNIKTNLFWYEIDDIIDLKNLNKIKNKID